MTPNKVEVLIHDKGFQEDKVKMLVYGESGVGKTVFGSTFPDPVFVDIDDGMSSIKKKIHRFQIDAWSDLQGTYEILAAGGHPWKSIIVDNLNEMQKLSLRSVVDDFPNVRRPYAGMPGQSDYGKMLFDFDTMFRNFLALPYRVIFIGQVAPRENDGDAVQPQLVGKHMPRDVARKMDVIGYLYKIEEGESKKTRVMVFDAANHVTKDRSGVLPAAVPNPTYSALLKYWRPTNANNA